MPSLIRIRPTPALIAGAATVHLLIGLMLSGRSSLWGDEAFTAETARLPLPDLLRMMQDIDVNMTAYYVVMHVWTAAFGDSEVALRLPSLLFTTGTVVLGGLWMRRWYGQLPSLVTAIVLALSPFMLWIGMTARPFGMLAFVTLVSLGVLVRALDSQRWTAWIVLALVDGLMLYTSLLGALVISAQLVYVVLLDRRPRRVQVPAALVLVLLSVPTLLYVAPPDTLNWLSTPTLSSVLSVGLTVTAGRYGLVVVVLTLIGLVVHPAPIGPPLRDLPRARWLLAVLLLVPLGVMIVLLPKQSLFTPPYLVTLYVAAALLAGSAVVRAPRIWQIIALLGAAVSLAAGILVLVVPNPALAQQDWRGTVAALDQQVQPGDAVVFPNSFYRVAGEHYARPVGFTDRAVPALPDAPWFSRTPYFYDNLKRTGVQRDGATVAAALDGYDRVWLVGPADGWMSSMTSVLVGSGWEVADTEGLPGVELVLLERSDRA